MSSSSRQAIGRYGFLSFSDDGSCNVRGSFELSSLAGLCFSSVMTRHSKIIHRDHPMKFHNETHSNHHVDLDPKAFPPEGLPSHHAGTAWDARGIKPWATLPAKGLLLITRHLLTLTPGLCARSEGIRA